MYFVSSTSPRYARVAITRNTKNSGGSAAKPNQAPQNAFVAARDRTEPWFWRRAAADLRAATASLAKLNATLARQCGADAPGLGGIEAALSDLASLIGVALSERQGSPAAAASRAPAAAMPAQAAPRAPAAAAPSRQSAYRDLANIAELLRRIEPHSPVPYLISRAVEWGALPFPELMARFANAGLDLAAVFELLGLAEWANASNPAAADHDDT